MNKSTMIRVDSNTIDRIRRYATAVAARQDAVYMTDDQRVNALLDVVMDYYLLKDMKPFDYDAQAEPQPELSFQ